MTVRLCSRARKKRGWPTRSSFFDVRRKRLPDDGMYSASGNPGSRRNPLENSLSSTSEIILKQLLQVKAAAVYPAGLQKGDPPGKVAVYGGILPPEQGLQPPADLFPAALTCGNEGAVCRNQTGWMEKMPGFKIRIYFHFFNTRFLQVIRSSDDGLRKAGRATDPAPETAAGHSSWWAKSRI